MTPFEAYQQYNKLWAELRAISRKASIFYNIMKNNPGNNNVLRNYYLLGKQSEKIICEINALPNIRL
ncbi:MAG: hypothetical protein JWQ38_1103 [Flavipsychrobacter sp.]|nr:hypothetical protein [Flavipsychrobacter sp.]